MDSVENAALKGRSSTAQEMSVEPENCVLSRDVSFVFNGSKLTHYPRAGRSRLH